MWIFCSLFTWYYHLVIDWHWISFVDWLYGVYLCATLWFRKVSFVCLEYCYVLCHSILKTLNRVPYFCPWEYCWSLIGLCALFHWLNWHSLLFVVYYRVIPYRQHQPGAYRLYMELLKRHAFSFASQIKGPSYHK